MTESVETASYLYRFPKQVAQDAGGQWTMSWPKGVDPFDAPGLAVANTTLNQVVVRESAFSRKECEKIVALGESCEWREGTIQGNAPGFRDSAIAWIEPRPEARWLYHRMGMLFAQVNQNYRFELEGFAEALQYTLYEPGGFFEWHLDLGPGTLSARKLSASILLSGPEDYAGGDLEFLNVRRPPDRLPIGTAIVFPSYLAHRVVPVESGQRRSLVAWAYGPCFR